MPGGKTEAEAKLHVEILELREAWLACCREAKHIFRLWWLGELNLSQSLLYQLYSSTYQSYLYLATLCKIVYVGGAHAWHFVWLGWFDVVNSTSNAVEAVGSIAV